MTAMKRPASSRGSHLRILQVVSLLLITLQYHQVSVSSLVVGGTAANSRGAPTFSRQTTLQASVDRLLELVDVEEVDIEANGQEIQTVVLSLSNQQQDASNESVNFTALLGNYNVTHVIPSKPNEKPVGGKWSRGPAQTLLKTRRTLQHLLAPKRTNSVAEAVNVITLSALRDFFRIHVILRGDAYPVTELEREDIVQERQTPGGLSSKTVRADFDPPRIVLARRNSSLVNLSIGPPSSVVLDTPYCDDRIRIGKGSRGSWFVFKRCNDRDNEADEWKTWIAQRPLKKSKALAVLAGTFGIGIAGAKGKGLCRVGGIVLSIVSLLVGAVVGFSSGGIEQDANTDERLLT